MWVNPLEDVRWSVDDLKRRAVDQLASEFADQDDLRRKAHAVATAVGVMTARERERWEAYNARQGQLEAEVAGDWATMQLLQQCFAVEAAQLALQQLPNDPTHAGERAAQQAVIDAATPDVMALVTTRNRVLPPEVI